jgi:hypothetical protein
MVTAGPARVQTQAPPAGERVGVAWMLFVDDLHADFRHTGRLRNLLKSIATELIQDGDISGMGSSAPSRVSSELTSHRAWLDQSIRKVTGHALKPDDIMRMVDRLEPTEVFARSSTALTAARQSLDRLIDYSSTDSPHRPKVLIYVSQGYHFDAMPSTAVTLAAPIALAPGREVSVATLSDARAEPAARHGLALESS